LVLRIDPAAIQLQERRPDAGELTAAPPPANASWLGWLRQSDAVWRPVALAPTLGKCWEALAHHFGDGDLLAVPTDPAARTTRPLEPSPK
jgi:hypothetical protein